MTAEAEVQQASDQFYAALNAMVNGDASPMAEIWSHESNVSTMHPLGGRENGWDAVRASWEGAAQAISQGSVEVSDLEVHDLGDVAYTLDVEHVDAKAGGRDIYSEVHATNIYRREGNAWKMVHHHADADRGIQEALGLA
jgi:ketosteroid isomerase-like protein